MIIDYSKEPKTAIENFKGGEKHIDAQMFFDGKNRILKGTLVPGASIGLHLHETSSEIIFILEGCGKVIIDDTTERVGPDMCHYCPKGHSHSLINDSNSNLVFLAVVPEQ